jgi:outer membrane protein assembly factor BamB
MHSTLSMMFRMLLVLVAVGGMARGLIDDSTAADAIEDSAVYRDPREGVLVPTSREMARRLAAARQAMQQGGTSEATALLQQLLRPDVADAFIARPENTATSHTLKFEAEQLLNAMPRAQWEWYELQFGPTAQKLLDEALHRRDPEALAHVSAMYLHTEAGSTATWMLARHWLDTGHARRALLLLSRLEEFPLAAQRFQPELSMLSCLSWVCLGERAKAQKVVASLSADYPAAVIKMGDEQLSVARDARRIVRLLDQICGTGVRQAGAGDEGIALGAGAAAESAAGWQGQLGELSWKWIPEQAGSGGSSIPRIAFRPLRAAGVVLARTPNGRLTAIEAESGRRVWEFPYHLVEESAGTNSRSTHVFRFGSAENWRRLRWQDAIGGRMNCDGQRVYLVDGLTVENSGSAGGLWNQPQVRRITGASIPSSNRLVAVSLKREGAIVWSVGGAQGGDEPQLAEAFFLGPPTWSGDRLYALAEMRGVVTLCALHVDSGRLMWSQPLAYPKSPITRDWPRRLAGAVPALAEGVLVCPTAAGAVVAVDALSGRLLWGYRYPRPQDAMDQRRTAAWHLMHRMPTGRTGWVDTRPTIAEGRVLATSADSEELLCLDLLSGRLEWAQDRGTDLYVACIHDGKVVVAGEDKMTARSLADGALAWSAAAAVLGTDAQPSGHGVHAGQYYYMPTTEAEILKVDLTTGKVVQRIKTPSVPGNLLGLGDRLVWQTPEGAFQFAPPPKTP